jgi:hypothetical protein
MGDAFASMLETYTTEQLELLVKFHQESIEMTKKEIARMANN